MAATALTGQQVGSAGTYFDDALRNDYQPAIREQFESKSMLLSNLEKGDAKRINTSGRFAQITLQKNIHPSVGAKAEGNPLPAKSYSALEASQVYMKYNYGRIEVSGPVIWASRDDRGAAISALEHEMSAVTNAMRKDVNRQLACGDGTGKLALVNGSSQTTTWTLDSLLGLGFTDPSSQFAEEAATKYFVAGMKVDVGDATTYTTIDVDSASVTSVNSATQITGSTISGHDDNGFFLREDAAASEMMGLGGIVDDGGRVDTLQAITRSTSGNSYWKSQVNDQGSAASPATLTEGMMQDSYSLVEQQSGEVSFVLCSYKVRDAYSKLLTPDKRYMNTTDLKGGFKSLDFNGVPLVADRDCTPYTAYFVDKSTLELYEMAPISWADKDGAVLRQVAGYDAYEATLFYYANLGTNAPFKNCALSFVQ